MKRPLVSMGLSTIRRMTRRAARWLIAACVTLALTAIALGPALGPLMRAAAGEHEHKCACGMKRGECGCKHCEQMERAQRQEQNDANQSRVPVVRSGCDDDELLMRAPQLPPAIAPLRALVPRAFARVERVPLPRESILSARERERPAVPPPRTAA